MGISSKKLTVSLDALIQREAFEIQEGRDRAMGRNIPAIAIRDLETSSFFYPFLRKPDFQRETNEWDPERICEFIESFLDGDLIPAIILWRSSGSYYFVVDGSHRLSSLIAWLNDDYGDGQISKDFYGGEISNEQKEAAKETRKLVNSRVKSYKAYQELASTQNTDNVKMLERARNLGALGISLQWVEGDAQKAEESFFKINQKAAPIGETEIRLIQARKTPNGIAARAIVRSGSGHKYWSEFPQETQEKIEAVAREINELIFQPKLSNPIKTLDVPIVANLSPPDKLELTLGFVNVVNNITEKEADEDLSGEQTIKLLNRCKKVAQRMNSADPSSLGLHPIIYFYTRLGRSKIGSFYGVISLMLHLEKYKLFSKFIEVRKDFEWLIWEHDMIPQIVRAGGALEARDKVKQFYLEIIEKLSTGTDKKNVIKEILAEKKFGTLKASSSKDTTEITSQKFSRETKAAAYLREAIRGCPKCKICGGYLPTRFHTIDHIKRKADGGLGTLDNAQLAHPYCNTTYKN